MREGKWILVSDGTAQTLYAGMTDLDEDGLDEAMRAHDPIELRDCRVMRTLMAPLAQGGITQNEFLSPVSIARSGIRVKVKPLMYCWPDEDEAMMQQFKEKLMAAKESETRYSAATAGIVTPGRQMVPGKMPS